MARSAGKGEAAKEAERRAHPHHEVKPAREGGAGRDGRDRDHRREHRGTGEGTPRIPRTRVCATGSSPDTGSTSENGPCRRSQRTKAARIDSLRPTASAIVGPERPERVVP